MSNKKNVPWNIVQSVVLHASAAQVWDVVGGFYTIHEWHPDIAKTGISDTQVSTRQMRRDLTFPGQPITTEELLFMDNENFHYRYKWYAGAWGEEVQNYFARIQVLDTDAKNRCVLVWASTFDYVEDAISQFYQNGFKALEEKFN